MKNKKYRVIFDGFETEEEAIAFAEWYEGDGEQHSGDWMSETTKVGDVLIDLKKFEKLFPNKKIIFKSVRELTIANPVYLIGFQFKFKKA